MERRQLESKKGGGRKGGFKEESAGGGEGAQLHEELLAGIVGGDGGEGGDGDDKKRFPSATATSSSSSASAVRRGGGSGGGVSLPCCQAERCTADLTEAKRYHRRHKVCEAHAKAAVVMVAGLRQRFCQQCSRFHELSEFDEAKRSCRRRLAGHNERRRKASLESQGEGSNHCRSEDPSGRMQNTLPANPTYKHFQIR